MECLVDGSQRAVVAPLLEIAADSRSAVDGGVLGTVARQVAPGAGVLRLVEDGLEHAAAVDRRSTSAWTRGREQGFDDGPLLVGEVSRVGAAHGEAVLGGQEQL